MIKRDSDNRRAIERRKRDIPVKFDRRILSERRLGEDRRNNFV